MIQYLGARLNEWREKNLLLYFLIQRSLDEEAQVMFALTNKSSPSKGESTTDG